MLLSPDRTKCYISKDHCVRERMATLQSQHFIRTVMKIINTLINSNIYIALAALCLAIETQIQLNCKPQFHPYLILIFFATLIEYNFNRFVTLLTYKKSLPTQDFQRRYRKYKRFYALITFSVLGFTLAVLLANVYVLLTLIPIACITVLYSLPQFKSKWNKLNLRQIPYIKIFLIAFVWSAVTILLPVVKQHTAINQPTIWFMLLERFLFVFAITIPFDIRDMEADKQSNLKTIPLHLGKGKALAISISSLGCFMVLTTIHYVVSGQTYILIPLLISAMSTIVFLLVEKLKSTKYYYYGILDGALLLQAVLVIIAGIWFH